MRPGAARGQEGSGLLSTSTGVLVFLVLLLLAVQVLFSLYATSAVTAAAYDAARIAAGSDGIGGGEAAARDYIGQVLGRYADGGRVEVELTPDPSDVVLTITAANPGFLPRMLRRPMGLDQIKRTARVRIERPRS